MDLNQPLGMTPPSRPRRNFGLIAVAIVAAVVLVGLGVFLATADPHGGEPYAVAVIPPAAPKRVPVAAPADVDPVRTGSVRAPSAPSESDSVEQGVKVFRAGQPPAATAAATGPLVIDVTKVLDDPLHRSGAIAKDDGTKVTGGSQPRIAIFVSGMGLSQAATRTATEIMPPGVTLAFVPYGETVPASVAAARAKGHEVLLQVPMQTGPSTLPGPHALRIGAKPAATTQDLAWLLGRFEGYDGVTNLLGAGVTADAQTMTALLKAVGSRGLFYLDDGTSQASLGPSLAPSLGVPAMRADLLLDATADPAVVNANLEALASIARRKGSAIGMASGLPDHLAAIARFAGDLGGRGIALVPVSALAARDATMAVAR